MVDFLRKKRQLVSFLIHASDLFSRFHWISSGIFIAPDAETTGEKGSELHLSQRVCVAGSSPKWPFVFSSSSPNWKQINHFRKNHEKNPSINWSVSIKKFGLGGGAVIFAETVWPWMRLALGVSFKSRPRNHANRLTKVTLLDTMRKVRGCWMLPSFRNQPRIFHTSLMMMKKKHAGIFQTTVSLNQPWFLENSWEIAGESLVHAQKSRCILTTVLSQLLSLVWSHHGRIFPGITNLRQHWMARMQVLHVVHHHCTEIRT